MKNPTQESTSKWYQPFPFDVPAFPVATPSDAAASSSSLVGEGTPKDPYIPDHLPSFPPAHTFKRSSSKKRAFQAKDGEKDKERGVRKAPRLETIKSAQSSLAAIEDSIDAVPLAR